METTVLMERILHGCIVRQNSKTGFFCANDVVAAGNEYRAKNKMKLFDFRSWIDSPSNKEFFSMLEQKEGKVIDTKKGKNGGTWVHPFIMIDLALSINPELKIETYKWIYDELIQYRIYSCDSYKKMCGYLYENSTNKSTFHRSIGKTADIIRNACGVEDWNKATEQQLKLRDRIHENIALLCDVLRDNNQAIRIGITKALNNNL